MSDKTKQLGQRLLSATTQGPIDRQLEVGGTAEQPTDPSKKVFVVAVAGDSGIAHSETGGISIAGSYGKATAGDAGLAFAGKWGNASANGTGVIAIVLDGGTANSTSDGGIAIAKDTGEAAAASIAISYLGGIVSAGEGGLIISGYRVAATGAIKFKVGRIGSKNKLKPGVKYTLDDRHNWRQA